MNRLTRIIVAALMGAAFLAAPAASMAKNITFGSRLDHEPSNSAPGHNCREDGSDDPTPTCTRIELDKSFGVKAGLRAPANGRIVKFSVRAGAPGKMTLRLVHLNSFAFNSNVNEWIAKGKGAGTGPTVSYKGLGFSETGNPVETFKANLKVHKGDYLGLDSTATSALYCSSGGPNQAIFSPKLGKKVRSTSKTDGCELMLQAVMKPAKKK